MIFLLLIFLIINIDGHKIKHINNKIDNLKTAIKNLLFIML